MKFNVAYLLEHDEIYEICTKVMKHLVEFQKHVCNNSRIETSL